MSPGKKKKHKTYSELPEGNVFLRHEDFVGNAGESFGFICRSTVNFGKVPQLQATVAPFFSTRIQTLGSTKTKNNGFNPTIFFFF